MGESDILTFHQNGRAGELLVNLLEAVLYENAARLCLVGHTSPTLCLYVTGLRFNERSGVEWEGGWGWGSSQHGPGCGHTRLSHNQGP